MPKHNPISPAVDLELDETTYKLAFDFEAVAEAEDVSGRALLTGLKRSDLWHPQISLVRAMFYGSLLPHAPKTTFEDAKALINQDNLPLIWGKIVEAWGKFAAPATDEPENPSPAQS